MPFSQLLQLSIGKKIKEDSTRHVDVAWAFYLEVQRKAHPKEKRKPKRIHGWFQQQCWSYECLGTFNSNMHGIDDRQEHSH
jgi:hypothetical protein